MQLPASSTARAKAVGAPGRPVAALRYCALVLLLLTACKKKVPRLKT